MTVPKIRSILWSGLILVLITPITFSFHAQDRIVQHSRHNINWFTPTRTQTSLVPSPGIESEGFSKSRESITGRSASLAFRPPAINRQISLGANKNDIIALVDDGDYLVTDSVQVRDEDRPTLLETLNNPIDILALLLIVPIAGSVSICNLFGFYTDVYTNLEIASVGLGIVSGLATFLQIATGYKITNHSRRLLVNDSNVNIYAGTYALATSWLALRASNACPGWLISMDVILPWVCIFVFLLAAVIPAITLLNPGNCLDETPPLSDTELLRARGLLGIGILASVFAPDCLAFGLGGSEWWDRVSALHPSQQVLESSTSLFALYANESSMIAHRCGRAGVAPFRLLVPSFAAVCFLLAILPCIAALYWMGESVSFFSFYRA